MSHETRVESIDRMKAKIAVLSDFAHSVSHDLKAPLRHIVTYSELLSEAYAGGLDENGRKFISRLTVNAVRAQRLIDRLLQYAEAEETSSDPATTDLQQLVAAVVSSLEEELGEVGAMVTTGPLPGVMARADDIGTVLEILFENALTYRGGAAPTISISGVVKESGVEISVSDNGIGVSEEFRERIFQPFKRLHSRDEIEGSGLGLAIARRLVERNGGEIGMRPNAPVGAVFYFTLPAAA